MEIGHVPIKMKDRIQKQFRDAINKQFDNLKIDEVKRTVFLYKQKLETISQPSRNSKQLKIEKDKILSTIKQLETDIALLENNIGFFAKTKNAESLINDVNARIEKAKKNIIIEKQKLDMIHKIENQKTVKA
jgi:putative ubiquitin-RnfH superfamily antitoxin RatB of RatAB toxin-antitoxin module